MWGQFLNSKKNENQQKVVPSAVGQVEVLEVCPILHDWLVKSCVYSAQYCDWNAQWSFAIKEFREQCHLVKLAQWENRYLALSQTSQLFLSSEQGPWFEQHSLYLQGLGGKSHRSESRSSLWCEDGQDQNAWGALQWVWLWWCVWNHSEPTKWCSAELHTNPWKLHSLLQGKGAWKLLQKSKVEDGFIWIQWNWRRRSW